MLRFNPQTGAWLLYARTPTLVERAEQIGLDQSIPASSREGCPVYYTHLDYAALPLWDVADTEARDHLFTRRLEYEASYADSGPPLLCPPDREFMPFQRAGIAYALSRPHVLIGDDMGLGKTCQAIGVANEMQAERVLVVCPANVRLQWQREVRAWSTVRRVSTYPILKSSDGTSPYANYTFVSYSLLNNLAIFNGLMAMKWDVLIGDEIHYGKSTEAQRAVSFFGDLSGNRPGLVSRAEKIVGLSGTPMPNRPREAYLCARHMCWEAIDWMSEDRFEFRYNPSMRGLTDKGKAFKREEQGRLPELRARLRCNFMVRRLLRTPEIKRQVDATLPQYELTYIEPNGAIKKALKAESLLKIDPERLEEIDAATWGHIATVRREMGVAKAPRVVEHVKMLLDGGLEKVVVFAHHREVVDYLAEKLAGGVRVWGSTTPIQRQRIVDQFIADPRQTVLIGQMQAIGVGTDGLQKVCRWAVLAEASWTPGDNEQVIRRIARHGQTREVHAQILVAPGSLDERVLGAALRKLHITHHALDGGD